MAPDETLIAAAETRVGQSAYRAKLAGRVADYRYACAEHELAPSAALEEAIARVTDDIAYLRSKMLSNGVAKRAADQLQSKAWRESRGG